MVGGHGGGLQMPFAQPLPGPRAIGAQPRRSQLAQVLVDLEEPLEEEVNALRVGEQDPVV